MKTIYPFLLGILYDYTYGQIGKDEVIKILKLVETYVIRRSVCNVQGGALSMTMASIYNELFNKYHNAFYIEPYKKVASKIVSINTNAYLPTDKKFQEEFTTRDFEKYGSYETKETVTHSRTAIDGNECFCSDFTSRKG